LPPPPHTNPLSQVAPPQQRCPEPPHATHVAAPPSAPLAQTKPLSQVPLVPPQHIWPPPPHPWHVPPTPFIAPMHVPPGWQTAPTQQVPPTAPQFWQLRKALPGGLAQPSPLLQVLRAQHASSSAPQAWQVSAPPPSPTPPWQANPALQLLAPLPPQHDWPLLPHALHVPAEHVAPDAVQVVAPPLPVQHAWASAPQVCPAAF
jgi:hypothetical protein